MPLRWRLLDYRLTGFHLNGPLAEAAGETTKRAESRPGREKSQHGLGYVSITT